MAVPKTQIFAVLRSSPDPLTFSGIVALTHKQMGTRDSLHVWANIESDNIRAALDELAEEGLITVKFVEATVYEVNE